MSLDRANERNLASYVDLLGQHRMLVMGTISPPLLTLIAEVKKDSVRSFNSLAGRINLILENSCRTDSI